MTAAKQTTSTMQDRVNAVITQRVKDILSFVSHGFALSVAIEKVKSSSCLGEKSWSEVIARVNEEIAKDNACVG